MRRLFFLISFLCYSFSFGQENTVPEKKTLNTFFSIDYLSVDMPSGTRFANEEHLGLSGIHYNLELGNFYTGVGIYGSVRGRRGGFFTLGVNAGYRAFLSNKLFLDTGFHFGGGGGAGAPDGGGAFILPKANLGYTFNKFAVQAGYSYMNFFDGGRIKGHQLNVALQIPMTIDYTPFEVSDRSYQADELRSSDWNKTARRMSFMLHLNNLSPQGNSQNVTGPSLNDKTIRLVGFEINSYLDDNWFLMAKFDGAYEGIPAGYMDILLGAGYHLGFNGNRTNILAKFAMGAGGGGGVETKGGVLMYPDISIEQHISNNVFFSVNTGYLMSPDGFFESRTLGAGLKYYTNINGVSNLDKDSEVSFKGFEIVLKQDYYQDANRILNPQQDLYQIALQLNYYLNKNIYLAGQTAFANFGNAGAYAEGIVGLGFQTNPFLKGKVSLFAQGLAGGAGGGFIATGEGLIYKPSVGIKYDLDSGLSLRGAAGYVGAFDGYLGSTMFNLGLSYRFSFLSSK